MNYLSEETNDDGIERVTENSFHDFVLEKEIKNLCDTLVKNILKIENTSSQRLNNGEMLF